VILVVSHIFASILQPEDQMVNYPVSEAQISAYQNDGVVFLPKLLRSQQEIDRLAGAVEQILTEETASSRNYFKRLRMWERNEVFKDLAFESAAPLAAAQLVRAEKLNLLYDQLFIKEPRSQFPTPWHNDHPYWPVRGSQVVTIWVALDEVTLANGAVEFVRGSHKKSPWYRPFTTDLKGDVIEVASDELGTYEETPDVENNRANFDIVSFNLQPGDAIAFHSLTLHGAKGNQSAHRRRAVSLRFTGSDVVYFAGPVWNNDITNTSLKTGDPLDSSQYPVVYRSTSTA
jgi:ectoine hydroxylase-related dioxygenase (phytanoyl-CoA dioxygenase family)